MWCFYRTKSAIQFKLIPAKYKEVPLASSNTNNPNGTMTIVDRQGAVLLEGAIGDNRTYNWNDKLTFAIADSDYSAIFAAFKVHELTSKVGTDQHGKLFSSGDMNLTLFHDPNANTEQAGKGLIKTFKIVNAKNAGTYYMNMIYTENGKILSQVNVGLSDGDLLKFKHFLYTNFTTVIGM